MGNITQAIEALGRRDWFDYVSAFTPIILSIIAVWIAIATARKQNQLALFDKKSDTYQKLLLFINHWQNGCEFILKGIDNKSICLGCFAALFNRSWKNADVDFSDVMRTDESSDFKYIHAVQCYYIEDISMLSELRFIYKCVDKSCISAMMDKYNNFMRVFHETIFNKVVADKLIEYTRAFFEELNLFHDKVLQEMEAELMKIKE